MQTTSNISIAALAAALATAGCGGEPDVRSKPAPLDAEEHVLSTPAVGTIPGSFSVGGDGSGRYSMPLEIPPPRLGVAPRLAITYDSARGDGIVGPGFSIAGLSSIERCAPTQARDGVSGTVDLTENDRLCLDGQRLEPVTPSVSYWLATNYRVVGDPTVRVVASGGSAATGPNSFEVWLPDGSRRFYGGGGNASVNAPTDTPTTVSWLMHRHRDVNGNYYTVNYDMAWSGGPLAHEIPEHFPQRVSYTGYDGEEGHEYPRHGVEFEYDIRPDAKQGFRFGFTTSRTRRLARIRTLQDNEIAVREYQLAYEADAVSGLSHLASVKECTLLAPDSPVCKPPTHFTWSRPKPIDMSDEGYQFVAQPVEEWQPKWSQAYGISGLQGSPNSFFALDFDGDGIEDIAFFEDEYFVEEEGWEGWVAPMRVRLGHIDEEQAFTQVVDTGILGYPGADYRTIDSNTDGKSDLLMFRPDQIVIYRSNGSGFDTVPTGLPLLQSGVSTATAPRVYSRMQVGDFNGDGQDDIMACGITEACTLDSSQATANCRGNWYFAAGNGTTFASWVDTGIVDRCLITERTQVGDFDGDGRDELLALSEPPAGSTAIGQGALRVASWEPSGFTATATDLCYVSGKYHDNWDCTGLDAIGGDAIVSDYNGDGNADLLLYHSEYDAAGVAYQVPHLAFGSGDPAAPFRVSRRALDPADAWFANVTNTTRRVHSSGGHSIYEFYRPIPVEATGDGRADFIQRHVARSDYLISCLLHELGICWTWGWPESPLDLFESDGYDFAPSWIGTWTPPGIWGSSAEMPTRRSTYLLLDGNGDGTKDFVEIVEVPEDYEAAVGGVTVRFNRGGLPNHVTTIENGLGSVTKVDYQPLTSTLAYEQGSGCAYPVRCVLSPRYVAKLVYRDNGTKSVSATTPVTDPVFNRTAYTYRDLRWDFHGGSSAGFAAIEVFDEATGLNKRTEFDNATPGPARDYPSARLPTRQIEWSASYSAQGYGGASSVYLATVTNMNNAGVGALGEKFKPTLVRTRTYEAGAGTYDVHAPEASLTAATDSTTTFTYDLYGYPLTSDTTHNADLRTRVELTRTLDTSAWLLGLVTEKVVRSYSGLTGIATRTTHFDHDADGRVIQVVDEPGQATAQVTTDVSSFDRYGNPLSIASTPVTGLSRTASMAYDETGTFVASATNAAGHLMSQEFHKGLGRRIGATDPNGRLTKFYWDGFGRARRVRRADGVETDITIGAATLGHESIEIERDTIGHGHTRTTYDRLGRELVHRWRGLGGAWNKVMRGYSARGTVHYASRPVSDSTSIPPLTIFNYDFAGRLLHRKLASGDDEYTWYGFRQRFERDAKGNVKTVDFDERGAIAAVHEPAPAGGTTAYAYSYFGALESVTDDAGHVTRATFDALGRQVGISDPNRGDSTLEFDAFGQLVRETHASGAEVTMVYDALGRLLTRTDSAGDTSFVYDTAVNGIGLLAGSSSPDSIEVTYDYDSLSRLVGKNYHIDSVTRTLAVAYDSLGHVSTVNAPTGFGYRRNIDTWGNLVDVRRLDGTLLFEVNDQAADGRPLRETFGNGVSTERIFNLQSGRLMRLETRGNVRFDADAMAMPTAVIDQSFAYDENGNLRDLTDHYRGWSETYTYDGLDRLTQLLRHGVGMHQWTYDTLGNMLSSPAGVHTYGVTLPDGTIDKPHAVTSVDGALYSYDAMGRMVNAPSFAVDYNSRDLPTSIQGSDGDTFFRYDAAGRRTVANKDATTTITLGDVYEVRIGGDDIQHKLLVSALGRIVAEVVRHEEAPGVYDERINYLHAGRLGSIEAVTTDTGMATTRTFTPFGEAVVDPTPLSPETLGVNRGFTGHLHDTPSGLVNMRGRIYAPAIGRFLTPDPIAQAPLDPRTLNPYSYVWNNPLNATDPSGFQTRPQEDPGDCSASPDCANVYDEDGELVGYDFVGETEETVELDESGNVTGVDYTNSSLTEVPVPNSEPMTVAFEISLSGTVVGTEETTEYGPLAAQTRRRPFRRRGRVGLIRVQYRVSYDDNGVPRLQVDDNTAFPIPIGSDLPVDAQEGELDDQVSTSDGRAAEFAVDGVVSRTLTGRSYGDSARLTIGGGTPVGASGGQSAGESHQVSQVPLRSRFIVRIPNALSGQLPYIMQQATGEEQGWVQLSDGSWLYLKGASIRCVTGCQ